MPLLSLDGQEQEHGLGILLYMELLFGQQMKSMVQEASAHLWLVHQFHPYLVLEDPVKQ